MSKDLEKKKKKSKKKKIMVQNFEFYSEKDLGSIYFGFHFKEKKEMNTKTFFVYSGRDWFNRKDYYVK